MRITRLSSTQITIKIAGVLKMSLTASTLSTTIFSVCLQFMAEVPLIEKLNKLFGLQA